MYKLIIADDEPWVAYRLSHLVDYPALGFEVVATVGDGPSALELCRSRDASGYPKTDVLLTDIRMPGLDGLELLHTLRSEDLPIEVVLISGYAEFTYAQAAVKDGAFDYLIKQVSSDQLAGVLSRLKLHLDQKHANARALQNIDALFRLFNDPEMTLRQWLELYHHPIGAEKLCFGCFQNAPQEALFSLRCGQNTICSLLECPDGQIPALAEAPAGFSLAACQDTSVSLLYRQCKQAYLTSVFQGLGKPYLYHVGSNDEVIRLLAEIEAAPSRTLLQQLEQHLSQLNIAQITTLYNRLIRIFNQHIVSDALADEELDYRQLVQTFVTPADMIAFFAGFLTNSPEPEESQFEPVLRYIHANLSQELRISELAERFHFSTSYFSTLFHKHVGMTFTKYLTQRRMEKALQLISNTQAPLQEIAEQSGYSDYFQFNKTFKKHFGVTPSAYRRQLQ